MWIQRDSRQFYLEFQKFKIIIWELLTLNFLSILKCLTLNFRSFCWDGFVAFIQESFISKIHFSFGTISFWNILPQTNQKKNFFWLTACACQWFLISVFKVRSSKREFLNNSLFLNSSWKGRAFWLSFKTS